MNHAIGIIGVGEIASAIVDGLCSGTDTAPEVFLSPRNQYIAADLAARYRTVEVCTDNQDVADRAKVVILAVRPDDVEEVLGELRMPGDRIVISAVAGIAHESLRRALGEQPGIVRAIPLPAVRQRRGVTAIYPAHPEVEQLFDSLGRTLVVDNAETLAVIQTASATISTFLHYLTTIASWLEERGVDRADADGYLRSLFIGVSDGLADRTRTLPELATAHETPGGLNEQLRRTWLTQQNSAALRQGLDAIYDRLAR